MNDILQFFQKLFDASDWPARWHCGHWTDFHGWLYIISDLLVWSAYFAIPLLILRYVIRQRQEVRFDKLYFLFAAFILACGATHFVDAMMFWVPMYRLSALTRLITGILSWTTVYYLVKLIPVAFSLKSSKELEREVALRQEAETELHRQNKMLNESQQMANVGSWEWNVKTGKITWSEQQYRIWGILIGTDLPYDLYISTIHPADREYITQHIAKALETKEYQNFYHRIITPAGDIRHILARGEVDTDETGAAIRLAGTSQDVTQLKHDELQLYAKTLELERKAGELEQFAYVASHDLQEPLRKIRTFSTMLKNGIDPAQQVILVDKIEHATGRMQQLIGDILDFSRVSNAAETFQPVNLNSILRFVRSDLETMIHSSRAMIKATNLPEIEAIPAQMQRLFQNLISNAIKFRKENTTPEVNVTSEQVLGAQIDVSMKSLLRQYTPELSSQEFDKLTYCRIVVSDNGIGFDPVYSEKIFQIFQRLHGRSEYEGTGIGLAICRRIVDNHHGYISASSAPGEGASFTIFLPETQRPFTTVA